jgi:hypothetical protein
MVTVMRDTGRGAINWIDLAQDRDQWTAPVNTIMNFRLHKMLGNSLVAAHLVFQEGLSSMELIHQTGDNEGSAP